MRPQVPRSGADPRVAVVIPFYNHGSTIREAYDSAVADAQEAVIVDDGSTEAKAIAELAALEQAGARVVRQPNLGVAGALMRGVEVTSSPYVFRLDADDVLRSGAVRQLADALDADPMAALAWGDIATFGSTRYVVPSMPILDPWLITYVNVVPSGALFRRDVLLSHGGWAFEDSLQDWDLLMQYAETGLRGVYVHTIAYEYRRSDAGLFTSNLPRFEQLYGTLRDRHPALFAARCASRRRSPAPKLLKASVAALWRTPFLSTRQRVRGSQLLMHVFWNGGLSTARSMITQRRGL